jgi:hypothetical protein
MKTTENQSLAKTLRQPATRRLALAMVLGIACIPYIYGQPTRSNPIIDAMQTAKEMEIGTPTTAALVKNIVYPMNYSTGLPEIKIPLYEVKCGELTLPIYLSYHASGIKLTDVAGWVGHGWSLIAEPMVTRTIRGEIDDPVTMTCPIKKEIDRTPVYVYGLTQYQREDTDEFYYRLAGKQGMFMYSDPSKKFLSVPYESIRIKYEEKHFQITDDDGTLYRFNGGTELGAKNLNLIGWKASSMVAANKTDSIQFVYDENRMLYLVRTYDDYITVVDGFNRKNGVNTWRPLGSPVPFTDQCSSLISTLEYLPDEMMQDPIITTKTSNRTDIWQCDDNGILFPDGTEYEISSLIHNVDTRTQPLREIHFALGKVVFTKDPKFPRLQEITIYDTKGNLVRGFRLNYITPNDRVTHRYYLESVDLDDENGESKEMYKFSYENLYYLPSPGDRSMDYWGYFNGVYRPDSVTLVPRYTFDVTRWKYDYYPNSTAIRLIAQVPVIPLTIGSERSRDPAEEYMKYGVLKGITYPTGSTDEFSYEVHRYKDDDGNIRSAGGLRVKSITTRDQGGVNRCRTFKYGIYEDGIGTPATKFVKDCFYLCQDMYIQAPIWYAWGVFGGFERESSDAHILARQRTLFSNPIRPITFHGGSSVMYDFVTEYNGTPENNSGKTEYQYNVEYTQPLPDERHTMRNDRHLYWKFGHLISKTVYRNDNGTYIPLEKTHNEYSTEEKDFGKIISGEAFPYYIIREPENCSAPIDIKYHNMYLQTTTDVGANLLKRSTRTVYSAPEPVVTTTQYEYADPGTTYPTRVIETGGGLTATSTSFSYPRDYDGIHPYGEMVARNILSPVIKKEYGRGTGYIGIETPYAMLGENVFRPSSTVVRRTPADAGDTRVTFLHDPRGRLRQETKDEKSSVVFLYGYNHQRVIARIENATFAEVADKLGGEAAVETISASDRPQMYGIDNLRQTLPDARVTTYTYRPPVGVETITDPFGLTTHYDLDGLGRLTRTYIKNGNRVEVLQRNEYHYANPTTPGDHE